MTQTRVTGQLYTYTDAEMIKKFGRDYAFTSPPPQPPSDESPQRISNELQNLDHSSKTEKKRHQLKESPKGKRQKSSDKIESTKSSQPLRSRSKAESPRRSKNKADEKASDQKEIKSTATGKLQKTEEIQASSEQYHTFTHTHTCLLYTSRCV